MAKDYFKRYIWLLNTIQIKKEVTLAELQRLWMRSSINDDHKELAPRSFANHIKAIEDIFGISIVCNRHNNTYSIENEDEIKSNDLHSWMIETLSLNNLLNESAGMKDRIIFENVPSSHKYLSTIIQAIHDSKILNIHYHSFRKENSEHLVFEPYCLREFKKRWYLIGNKFQKEEIRIIALDRILDIEIDNLSFSLPKDFSIATIVENYYGVRMYEKLKPELVTIRTNGRQAKYFRSLPLHFSQEEIENNGNSVTFQYFLAPDYDFKHDILSFGPSVEVLAPTHLRDEIKKMLEQLIKVYS